MSKVKTNAIRLLDQKKISYELLTYEVDDQLDGITVATKINYPVEVVYKTLVTRGNSKNIYVFVIPVATELDLKKAAKVVAEKKLEMIAVSEINGLTGYIRGGCSPVGMKKVYPTVIDVTAQQLDYFIVSGGKIGLQMKLNPKDLEKVITLRFEKVTIEKGDIMC
ncbi:MULTISPECIES: Cys-tRNA(Pro) deacylase [Turicibacter]|uniref:Cys-tRNA(Pro)/Cys-tRNA(Cys) deacylase n=2 Tax=Turicibacter sanguinis TaxID=154288 RepID=A0A9X5APT3_9FIRM|nr:MULTISPECIES: Cys-tRNA(Pro) deacylase [Turicibacter]EFF62919.1 ybaK/ebsC protein [Turicibacter sanguinis PC909]EGC92810.1 YbaK/EbsC protein [Turicibacter sp. HGF1]MBP3903732.1 Cys-tRNA(Pro) deacylase [Turicibacter sp.]MCU7195999.1 Cys-tRNA(Pro) deacylase [Turicibacter sanguinis]MCU7210924.1 Cys-tRNA(Pro) deacylase [Turicibacter sanguinis]